MVSFCLGIPVSVVVNEGLSLHQVISCWIWLLYFLRLREWPPVLLGIWGVRNSFPNELNTRTQSLFVVTRIRPRRWFRIPFLFMVAWVRQLPHQHWVLNVNSGWQSILSYRVCRGAVRLLFYFPLYGRLSYEGNVSASVLVPWYPCDWPSCLCCGQSSLWSPLSCLCPLLVIQICHPLLCFFWHWGWYPASDTNPFSSRDILSIIPEEIWHVW